MDNYRRKPVAAVRFADESSFEKCKELLREARPTSSWTFTIGPNESSRLCFRACVDGGRKCLVEAFAGDYITWEGDYLRTLDPNSFRRMYERVEEVFTLTLANRHDSQKFAISDGFTVVGIDHESGYVTLQRKS